MDTPGLAASDAKAASVAKVERVTLDHLKSLVVDKEFYNPSICPHLTICVVRVKNGFTVIGSSAPADPVNFDRILGQEMAYEDALGKLWPLEGYLLRERLHERE